MFRRASIADEAISGELQDQQQTTPETQHPETPPRRTMRGFTVRGQTLTELQDYRNVTFTGPVIFRDVTLAGGCDFDGAVFRGGVQFSRVRVPGNGGINTKFTNCTFDANTLFFKSRLHLANFSGSTFNAQSRFRWVYFSASANFDNAVFDGPANFKNSVFHGAGNFRNVVFRSSCEFEKAEFRSHYVSHARFGDAKFENIASFLKVLFSGHAEFKGAFFAGGAIFDNACFGESISSDTVNDASDSNGSGTQADRRIDFTNTTFLRNNNGKETEIVSFRHVRFGDKNFVRDANFEGAKFGLSEETSTGLAVAEFRVSYRGSVNPSPLGDRMRKHPGMANYK